MYSVVTATLIAKVSRCLSSKERYLILELLCLSFGFFSRCSFRFILLLSRQKQLETNDRLMRFKGSSVVTLTGSPSTAEEYISKSVFEGKRCTSLELTSYADSKH